MRNLKKILALVLSLMMVLSVMVTASAADFSDADEIQYAEAVDVLNGLGILTGSQGKFAPNGTLTRAQAAKIITFIALGEDTDKLVKGTGSAQFSDVTGGWAYDYVSYCANEKIISGSQGKFFPDAEVTGYQFGKMVLNVLGIEGTYTGSGWELRVATGLKTAKLTAGLAKTFSLNRSLTREEAAQIAFNAMNYVTETVYGYRIYKVVDSKPVYASDFYSTLAEAAAAANALNTIAGTTTYYVDTTKYALNNTLGHKGYGLDSYEGTVNGVGGHFWYVYDPAYAITGVYADDAVLSETTDGTSLVKLTSGKGSDTYDASKFVAQLNPTGVTYYFNGYPVSTNLVLNSSNVSVGQYYMSGDGHTIKVFTTGGVYGGGAVGKAVLDINSYGKGVTVKLVNEAGTNAVYAEKVLFELPTYATVSKIKAVAETKTEGAHTAYTIGGKTYKVFSSVVKPTEDITNVDVYAGIAVGDKVIVTDLANTAATVVKATTITGKVTATSTADGSITIDGTKYFTSEVNKANIGNIVVSKATVSFDLDANGYIVKALDAAADPFVYVAANVTASVNVLEDGVIVPKFRAPVMYSDGTYGYITVAKVGGADASASNITTGLYTYTVDATTGEYLLTSAANDASAAITVRTNEVASGVYANASTKYVFAKFSEGKLVGTTIYTGVSAYPVQNSGVSASYITVSGNGKIADVVFVVPTTAAAGAEVTYAWYLGTSSTELVDGKAVVSYDVVIDGVKTVLTAGKDVDSTTAASVFDGTAKLVKVTSGTNVVAAAAGDLTASATLQYNSGLMFVDGINPKTVDAGVPVYVFTSSTGAYATYEASDLAGDEAVTGAYKFVEATVNGTLTVVAIYVVK